MAYRIRVASRGEVGLAEGDDPGARFHNRPKELWGEYRERRYGELVDAAQDAEYLHAEVGRAFEVLDGDGGLAYTSQGAPE